MKYIGIDYGAKRIGVAVSDDGGAVAFPHGIIPRGKHPAEDIVSLAQELGATAVVFGISKDGQGNDNAIMGDMRAVMEQIEKKGNIAVHGAPEAYTSVEARRLPGYDGFSARRPANTRGKQQKPTTVDDRAATLILQRFLEAKQAQQHEA